MDNDRPTLEQALQGDRRAEMYYGASFARIVHAIERGELPEETRRALREALLKEDS